MRAGLLNKKIDVLTPVAGARGAYGGVTETWTLLATVSADVRFGSPEDGGGAGGEGESADRIIGSLMGTFSIRWRRDIQFNSALRIRYNGQIFNVRNVATVGRNEKLVLRAEAENT